MNINESCMVSIDNLLNELRNGKSVDDLANQLIDTLNEANTKYQKEQEQEAATAREADCIACITNDLNEYFKNNNCDFLVFTEDEVASILQGAVQFANLLSTLAVKKDAVKNKITDIDEVIANWIDKLG